MQTYSGHLKAQADAMGVPPRTVDDVRKALTKARKHKSDASLARLLLNHGRLTDEARAFVEAWK